MRKQQGFTLIELIVVIVILGILAATAMPKFLDIRKDARIAALEGAAGAMSSAADLAHAAYLISGNPSNSNVTLDNTSISMVNGYPTAAVSGIVLAAQLGLNNEWHITYGTNDVTIKTESNAPATCNVKYTQSGNGQKPSITLTTSGCN